MHTCPRNSSKINYKLPMFQLKGKTMFRRVLFLKPSGMDVLRRALSLSAYYIEYSSELRALFSQYLLVIIS